MEACTCRGKYRVFEWGGIRATFRHVVFPYCDSYWQKQITVLGLLPHRVALVPSTCCFNGHTLAPGVRSWAAEVITTLLPTAKQY